MSPLVRRTWAPRGHRPVLYQRGRHREKVSLAAALWLSPQGDPERVSYRLLSDSHFNNEAVAAFHESGAHRLVIIHRPDELPLDEGIERAADGDVYTF